MSAYGIEWSTLIDQRLVDELSAAAGDAPVSLDAARPLIARILRACGGWPYVAKLPSRASLNAHMRRLIAEAVAHSLGTDPAAPPGFTLVRRSGKPAEIAIVQRIAVNFADAGTLAALPGISVAGARQIVVDREQRGPFRDANDLCRRLPRIGKARMSALSSLISFRAAPAPLLVATGELHRDMAVLASVQRDSASGTHLLSALRYAAERAESDAHPHAKNRLRRPITTPKAPEGVTVEESLVLAGRRYYAYLQDAFRSAAVSVDVLMFHIALPREDHPTRRLLDALDEAHRRGVRVRVLVDRDRQGDPYRSRAINAAAIKWLVAKGIPARVDRADRLLHSKMIVIDASETIIGSHNWSAGSFFSFDDLSLAVRGTAYARTTRSRFETLWKKASPAQAERSGT